MLDSGPSILAPAHRTGHTLRAFWDPNLEFCSRHSAGCSHRHCRIYEQASVRLVPAYFRAGQPRRKPLIKINSSSRNASDYEAWYGHRYPRLSPPATAKPACSRPFPNRFGRRSWQRSSSSVLVNRLMSRERSSFWRRGIPALLLERRCLAANRRAEAVALRHVAWSNPIIWRRDP